MGKDAQYLKSCFNYTGGKFKLLKQIVPLFPDDINHFVDLFCGGSNVAINVSASKEIICIDNQEHIIDFYNTLKNLEYEETVKQIEAIINEFQLSNTVVNGYSKYNCDSGAGLGEYNKEKFLKLRDYYNSLTVKNDYKNLLFYVLTVYGFNNQIRFNKSGKYNIPVGKRDFNRNIRDNLKSFVEAIKQNNIQFICKDFKETNLELTEGDFLYADPPYLISTATYNESNRWTSEDDKALLSFLDNLNDNNVRFALSNVLEHKGECNEYLIKWSEKYNVHFLNKDYSNSNYQIKDKKSKTIEVLITNYNK